jgi:hypothetical protein
MKLEQQPQLYKKIEPHIIICTENSSILFVISKPSVKDCPIISPKFTLPYTLITANYTDSLFFLQNRKQDISQHYLASPSHLDACLPADIIY